MGPDLGPMDASTHSGRMLLALQAGQNPRTRFRRLARQPQYRQRPNLVVQDVQAGIASEPIGEWPRRSCFGVPLGFAKRLQCIAILTDFKPQHAEDAISDHIEGRVVLPPGDLQHFRLQAQGPT